MNQRITNLARSMALGYGAELSDERLPMPPTRQTQFEKVKLKKIYKGEDTLGRWVKDKNRR